MTFEGFFKKKKISLDLLQNSEPALFAEFKNHYKQMGEKSFDHTKKYWFNKLRLKCPAPAEIKVEKIHIENQLAEQTINEALSEETAPAATTGFKPRFKAAVTAKPVEEKPADIAATAEEKPAEQTAPAVGFKPRFKAAMVAKPAEEKPAEPEVKKEDTETPPADDAPKRVGFKPRFNAAKMKPKE